MVLFSVVIYIIFFYVFVEYIYIYLYIYIVTYMVYCIWLINNLNYEAWDLRLTHGFMASNFDFNMYILETRYKLNSTLNYRRKIDRLKAMFNLSLIVILKKKINNIGIKVMFCKCQYVPISFSWAKLYCGQQVLWGLYFYFIYIFLYNLLSYVCYVQGSPTCTHMYCPQVIYIRFC